MKENYRSNSHLLTKSHIMKKLALLFAMVVFAFGNAFAQSSLYFDFEGQTAGNKIAQTLGAPWTTWSGTVGGAEDGVFDMADGSMAAHFTKS